MKSYKVTLQERVQTRADGQQLKDRTYINVSQAKSKQAAQTSALLFWMSRGWVEVNGRDPLHIGFEIKADKLN